MEELRPSRAVDDVLEPYRAVDRAPRSGRPWVMANMVAGLDGSASVGGRVGELSGPTDRRLFRLLRSLADIVLVGAETVRTENYGRVTLPPELVSRRREAGQAPVPRLAVVTRSMRLDPGARLFEGDPETRPFILTSRGADPSRRSALSTVADIVEAGDDGVDLGEALEQLGQGGASTVLCEGGPAVLGQLVERGLLDELCLTVAPVMGGDALPVSVSRATSSLARFRLGHVLTDEDVLFLRYEREDDR